MLSQARMQLQNFVEWLAPTRAMELNTGFVLGPAWPKETKTSPPPGTHISIGYVSLQPWGWHISQYYMCPSSREGDTYSNGICVIPAARMTHIPTGYVPFQPWVKTCVEVNSIGVSSRPSRMDYGNIHPQALFKTQAHRGTCLFLILSTRHLRHKQKTNKKGMAAKCTENHNINKVLATNLATLCNTLFTESVTTPSHSRVHKVIVYE